MSRIPHLLSLIRSLHPTPLRQSNTNQLSNALENIVHRAFPSEATATASATQASGSSATAGSSSSSSSSSSSAKPLGEAQEKAIEGMIAAVGRIKAGEAVREYPLSDRTLRPRHDPHYYTRLLEGVHRSARGQGRSWWRSFFQLRGQA